MNNRNNTAGGDEGGWGREKSRGGEGIGRNGRARRAHGRTENWGRKRVCARIVAEREGATARAGGRVRVEPRSHRGARQQLPRIKSAKQVARAAPPCVAVWVRVRWRREEWGGGKGKRKVTFDVQPEVAIIKDEGEVSSEQPTPSEVNEGWCILSPTKRTW